MGYSRAENGIIESIYTVRGMTCEHCVRSVSAEVGRITGVRAVRVDLGTGRVAVTSDKPLAGDEVGAAVAEAGYQLLG
jgi:copper chaperone